MTALTARVFLVLALLLKASSVNAIGSCGFDFQLGERSAFICNEAGQNVRITICSSTPQTCEASALEAGISVFERPAGLSEYLSVSASYPDGERYYLVEGFDKESFDWSRIVYLVAGSLIAFFAGYGSRYIAFVFEQQTSQRRLVREWRDSLIGSVRAITDDSSPDLSFAPPSGLSSRNVRRIMKVHDKLQALFNKVRLGQVDVEAAKIQAVEIVLSERAG